MQGLVYPVSVDLEKHAFAQRLSEAMEAAGHEARPSVLEREFNKRYWGKSMTRQGVRRWLVGQALPSQEKLVVLAQWLQVDPHVLRFGHNGALRVSERQTGRLAELGWSEREIIDAFMRLPVGQRRIVREVILAFSKAYPPER